MASWWVWGIRGGEPGARYFAFGEPGAGPETDYGKIAPKSANFEPIVYDLCIQSVVFKSIQSVVSMDDIQFVAWAYETCY